MALVFRLYQGECAVIREEEGGRPPVFVGRVQAVRRDGARAVMKPTAGAGLVCRFGERVLAPGEEVTMDGYARLRFERAGSLVATVCYDRTTNRTTGLVGIAESHVRFYRGLKPG